MCEIELTFCAANLRQLIRVLNTLWSPDISLKISNKMIKVKTNQINILPRALTNLPWTAPRPGELCCRRCPPASCGPDRPDCLPAPWTRHVMSMWPANYWTPFTFSQYDDDENKIDSTEGDDADQQHSPGPVAERAKECLSEYHVVPSYK